MRVHAYIKCVYLPVHTYIRADVQTYRPVRPVIQTDIQTDILLSILNAFDTTPKDYLIDVVIAVTCVMKSLKCVDYNM